MPDKIAVEIKDGKLLVDGEPARVAQTPTQQAKETKAEKARQRQMALLRQKELDAEERERAKLRKGGALEVLRSRGTNAYLDALADDPERRAKVEAELDQQLADAKTNAEEVAHALDVLKRASKVLSTFRRVAHLSAARGDADETLAFWLTLADSERITLGLPTTERDFEDWLGLSHGYVRARKRSKDFNQTHFTDGILLDRARQALPRVMDNLERIVSEEDASSAHFNTYFKLAGTFVQDKDELDGVGREQMRSLTPEQHADEWVPRMLSTAGGKGLVRALGGSKAAERAEHYVRKMIVGLYKSERDDPRDESAAPEAPTPQVDDALVIEVAEPYDDA